jgi:hypothetical protein
VTEQKMVRGDRKRQRDGETERVNDRQRDRDRGKFTMCIKRGWRSFNFRDVFKV